MKTAAIYVRGRVSDALDAMPTELTAAHLRALRAILRQSRRRGEAEEYVKELLNAAKQRRTARNRRKGIETRVATRDAI